MNQVLSALLWGIVLAVSGGAVAAGADTKLERFQSTQIEMGVPFKILLYAPDKVAAKGACEAAFSRVAELNTALSDYDPSSELSRLSATAPTTQGVPLGPDLWAVLARSQKLAEQTDGAFDVTVGPLVRLWRRARRQKEMPSPERLAEARAAVGFRNLQLDADKRTARLLVPNMRLDLGGIGIGYAVDEAMAVIRARGITRALIDASGDVAASDPPPGKDGWIVSVIPLSAEGTPSRDVVLANAAVTVSGDAFQHVVIDGRRYSHIVDPHTGLGLTDQTGVTVIARDCTTADSLDTAVSVLGPEAGLKLVEATPGAAAFIVRDAAGQKDVAGSTSDGAIETFESSRFKAFVKTPVKP
jgi:thiamine biosynthesis lipoprotein